MDPSASTLPLLVFPCNTTAIHSSQLRQDGNLAIAGPSSNPSPHPAAALLHQQHFPYKRLMGQWAIVGSSLPLWKGKANVICRYTPESPLPDTAPLPTRLIKATHLPPSTSTAPAVEPRTSPVLQAPSDMADQVRFYDEIYYDALDEDGRILEGKGVERGGATHISGRNTIDDKGRNGASFHWRGFWWLKPFTSRWQVLGFSRNFVGVKAPSNEPEWIITYFSATLFTPAGVDVYAREASSLSDETLDEIIQAMRQGGLVAPHQEPWEENLSEASAEHRAVLRRLAGQVFRIPHTRPTQPPL
ncbi:hypothetical protein IE81DRAFT_323439 [Ceraceosorus guamensis]|uniref:Uncharacterized protein n=1 Tax=Ceraceosorus guamensis TaxID=1522189 RepID=A0A316VXT2_9BASI|nr:hypothetical protein IE81DRAFT_323439 [Ceraceosorus guamensis]PWN42467.1 hypothetical protein IE81DRAFT_323439 [Ceraceosorus guamensis]